MTPPSDDDPTRHANSLTPDWPRRNWAMRRMLIAAGADDRKLQRKLEAPRRFAWLAAFIRRVVARPRVQN